MREFETIRYEMPEPAIARIVLDRPEVRNAQDVRMTYEINDALDIANADDAVKVVVLAAAGPHFSSGHDLRAPWVLDPAAAVGTWRGYGLPGAEGYMALEEEVYLQMCLRWRALPKPLVAAAQGKTIAGGLMLLWVADVIVAADDAEFRDPVLALGVNGVELFTHLWEVGHRKAKEMLFTGDALSAEEALRVGMVNHVVPRAELAERTLELARRMARQPSFALKLAKESVNQSLDAQGLLSAVKSAFALHQLAHSHNQEVHGHRYDPEGPERIRRAARGEAPVGGAGGAGASGTEAAR